MGLYRGGLIFGGLIVGGLPFTVYDYQLLEITISAIWLGYDLYNIIIVNNFKISLGTCSALI